MHIKLYLRNSLVYLDVFGSALAVFSSHFFPFSDLYEALTVGYMTNPFPQLEVPSAMCAFEIAIETLSSR